MFEFDPLGSPVVPVYYEAHITIEPVFDERLEEVQDVVHVYKFRVADLLMKKRIRDTEKRSACDTFCTSRGPNYGELLSRTKRCVQYLTEQGFAVWRYKIEAVLLDERLKGLEHAGV